MGVAAGFHLNLDARLYFSESDSIFHFLKPFVPVVLLFWTDRQSLVTSHLQENLIFVPICRLMSLVTSTSF